MIKTMERWSIDQDGNEQLSRAVCDINRRPLRARQREGRSIYTSGNYLKICKTLFTQESQERLEYLSPSSLVSLGLLLSVKFTRTKNSLGSLYSFISLSSLRSFKNCRGKMYHNFFKPKKRGQDFLFFKKIKSKAIWSFQKIHLRNEAIKAIQVWGGQNYL